VKRLFAFAMAFLFVAGTSSQSYAKNMTEVALLARCYAHLTGRPLPVVHTLRSQVEAGTLSAATACEQVLEKASIGANGYLTASTDVEARAVLQNFNNFHRSWFPGNIVEGIQEFGLETSRGTQDIYDSTEPGLAVTRALFAQGARYADVLTLPTGVHAIREEDAGIKARQGWSVTIPSRRIFGNNTALDLNLFHFTALSGLAVADSDTAPDFFATLPKIEVGELVGIRTTTETANIPNVNLSPLGSNIAGNTIPGLNFSFDLFKTQGGGVLGTPIYLMLNYGHGRGVFANGTTKVPRRWAQTNMNTFMCANLPALRESDVTKYYVGSSSAPFRNSMSCLRCHANLDPMAYTARNVITSGTAFTEFTLGSRTHAKAALVTTTFNADAGTSTGWPSEPVLNFQRMTPTGKLYFRSFASGELINKDVTGISGLGAAMTTIDDYYQCAAKRYFAFFTGIQVSLYDKHDPNNAALNRALTEKDVKDRTFIENLAAELKQTQSLKTMIKKIMASDYYQTKNYNP